MMDFVAHAGNVSDFKSLEFDGDIGKRAHMGRRFPSL